MGASFGPSDGAMRTLSFLILFFTAASNLSAESQAQNPPPAPSSGVQLEALEIRLVQIEANQKKILEKQDEILKQLDTLRIWVRHN